VRTLVTGDSGKPQTSTIRKCADPGADIREKIGAAQKEELPVRTDEAQQGPLCFQLDLPDSERSDEVPRCTDREGCDRLSGCE